MSRRPIAPALVLALVAVGAAAPGQPEVVERCAFADDRIAESSGLARSAWRDDVVWTHNDSDQAPFLFAVELEGCTTVATVRVAGATAFDWEDLASGPSPRDGSPALFVADTGDNVDDGRSRETVEVVVVTEPDVRTRTGTFAATGVATYRFAWPAAFADAETLLLDPAGGALLLTKDFGGRSAIWRAPLPATVPAEVVALTQVGLVDVGLVTPPVPGETGFLGPFGFLTATGGDVAPDGRQVVVRTYDDLLVWEVGDEGLAAALTTTPRRFDLPSTEQGEGVTFLADGSLVVSSEGRGAPVQALTLPRPPSPAPAVVDPTPRDPTGEATRTGQEGAIASVGPTSPDVPTATGRATSRWAAVVGVGSVVVVGLAALRRRRR